MVYLFRCVGVSECMTDYTCQQRQGFIQSFAIITCLAGISKRTNRIVYIGSRSVITGDGEICLENIVKTIFSIWKKNIIDIGR